MTNLERNGIKTVADVRSTPQSRHVPHFNQDRLERALEKLGIRYAFMGAALGGRPSSSRMYDEQGRVRYDRMALENTFRQALRELQQTAGQGQTTIMCTEGDPLRCHRTLMVAQELEKAGTPVSHILTDGSLVTHQRLMERLMRQLGFPQESDRTRREQLLDEAVLQQAAKAGYRRQR